MPTPTTVLLRAQSDERLVALARAGHERAFEAIVERYRRPLLRACRRVLPEARAEDAVQQTLVAAWHGLSRGDEVRELRPWLYRIAHNTALNQLRVAGYDYDELHGMLTGGPVPEEELERREIARSTLAGLAALPARQRQALLGIAVQGRGQDEVAGALGISEPAVRQLVHRARTHLRAAVTAVTPWPLAGWPAAASPR
jgi:RNA polymerase sigma factor (sigma-70 family)